MATPADRCGFTWDRADHKASCCYRPEAPGESRCVWHTQVTGKDSTYLDDSQTVPGAILDGAFLRGATLDGMSFADVTIRDAEFERATLTETSFERASVQGSNFEKATLPGVSFAGSDAQGAQFREATCYSANFRAVHASHAVFSNCDLSGATFTDAGLAMASLDEATLTGADMDGCKLIRANLRGARLNQVDLSGGTLAKCDCSHANLGGADLRETMLDETNFESSFFAPESLSGATCHGAGFVGLDLRHVDLFPEAASGASFREATLTEMNLAGRNFENADFTDAQLTDAVLTDANLEGALFSRAQLFGADLTNARLYGAILGDAQLNMATEVGEYIRYDPRSTEADSDPERALKTYRELERLGRQGGMEDLHSQMFLRRKDLQRQEYRETGRYTRWLRSVASNLIIRYGESPWRVLASGLGVILFCTLLYPALGLMDVGTGSPLTYSLQPQELTTTLAKSLYFSTLTFTTLGLGDFQPVGMGQFVAILETATGATILALLVFVFGRRATR